LSTLAFQAFHSSGLLWRRDNAALGSPVVSQKGLRLYTASARSLRARSRAVCWIEDVTWYPSSTDMTTVVISVSTENRCSNVTCLRMLFFPLMKIGGELGDTPKSPAGISPLHPIFI